jgi:hypothetical protein
LAIDIERAQLNFVEFGLTAPLQGLSPGVITEPVTDVISVTSIDQDGDLLQQVGNERVEGQHPVTVKQEVAIDVKIARLELGNLASQSFDNFWIVQVLADPLHFIVAKRVTAFARTTDVIDIRAGTLVRADHSIVAIYRSRNTGPDRFGAIAVLDKFGTSGIGRIHSTTLRLAKNGLVSTLTTGHGPVVIVLSESVSKTVADSDRLEIDVAFLVSQNLSGELRNVMTATISTDPKTVFTSTYPA